MTVYAFNLNSPNNLIDPDGACATLPLAVDGVIGGGVDWYQDKSTREIAIAAGKGAIVGGIAGATGGLAGGAVGGWMGGLGDDTAATAASGWPHLHNQLSTFE